MLTRHCLCRLCSEALTHEIGVRHAQTKYAPAPLMRCYDLEQAVSMGITTMRSCMQQCECL